MFNWLKKKRQDDETYAGTEEVGDEEADEGSQPVPDAPASPSQPAGGHYKTVTIQGVKTHTLHAVMGYGIWLLLCVLGGIALVLMSYQVMGFFSALFIAIGAALTAFVAWFPTHCAARGRGAVFRFLCLLLDLVACFGTAFVLATTGQMLIEREARTAYTTQAQTGANTINSACVKQAKESQRAFNRRCTSVTNTLKGAMGANEQANEAEAVKIPFLVEARPYVRYLEFGIALIVGFGMALLWIAFGKSEDLDGDGVLDAFGSSSPTRKRIWVPAPKTQPSAA